MRSLRSLFGKRGRRDNDLDREIAFHIEELSRHAIAEGITADEARRQAKVAFGGSEQVKQQLREVHTSVLFEAIRFHTLAAFRFLRRAPGLSAAIILTLALGIGANTAVFSAIDAILLRPLPFPHGDELMVLHQVNVKGKQPEWLVAPPRLEDWNRLNSTFQAVSGYYTEDESETSGPLPERLDQALVAPRFLQVWGVAPTLGRGFTAEEERFGGPDAVMISDRFWQRRFYGDPHVIGQKLRLGTRAYTIVGVMPASFLFPDHDVDIYGPSPVDAPYAQSRESTWFNVVGRLKPGTTLAQARADLATVQRQLGLQFPKTDRELSVQIEPLKSMVVGESASSLWLLYGSVSLLLLIACTNIAALLLARLAEREREIAVRFALGASRRTVVAQLLSETLLLALAGSALGLVLAVVGVQVFHQLAATLPRAQEITLNWRLLLYTFGSALLVTLLCGLVPALCGTRRELARSLASGSHTQVGRRRPLQWMLVGTQVAFAVTLLVGAGLLLRSFAALDRVSAGFDPDHVLTFQVSGMWGETADMKRLVQRIDGTLDSLRTVAGVESAATTALLPGVPGQKQVELALVEGERNSEHKVFAVERYVSSGYFQTLHIPMLLGEGCHPGSGNKTMVVNQRFANLYLAQNPAIGSHVQSQIYSSSPFVAEIRGVAGDAREDGLNVAPTPTIYWCTSAPGPSPFYLVRAHGNAMALAETLRRKLHQIEPGRSVFGLSPLQDHLDDTQAVNRMRTALLTLFAGIAISLAGIGLYGTLSYLGRVRRREMGLRLAVGASRAQVTGAFLSQGLRVVGIGCVVGLMLSLAGSRLIQGMLYGVSATDPVTYLGIVLLIVLVAGVASIAPAVRVTRINLAQVLRDE